MRHNEAELRLGRLVFEGTIIDVGGFVKEIGPYYPRGKDRLARLLKINDWQIPDKGPGCKSIPNAIRRAQEDCSLSRGHFQSSRR